jgi:hypothetical protein
MVAKAFVLPERFQIVKELTPQLQTGDILVRRSDTKGPFGIPFSTLVAMFTGSPWSHASILYLDYGRPRLVEITDTGTYDMRLIDWLDFCVDGKFAVYRLRGGLSEEKKAALQIEIDKFLAADPDYDPQYAGPESGRFYCTSSVAYLYQQIGFHLITPYSAYDAVYRHGWGWYAFQAGNWLVKKLTGKGFNLDAKFYFVGTEDRAGLLRSPLLERIYLRG